MVNRLYAYPRPLLIATSGHALALGAVDGTSLRAEADLAERLCSLVEHGVSVCYKVCYKVCILLTLLLTSLLT